MSTKYRRIQIINDDIKKNHRNKGYLKQNNLGKPKFNKKLDVNYSNNDNKNYKINKSLEFDERKVKKRIKI